MDMTTSRSTYGPVLTGLDLANLAESLDIRFLVAGRLSPSTVQIRRDRVELAEVLGQAQPSPNLEELDGPERRALGTIDD
jgi:hypothetical protein